MEELLESFEPESNDTDRRILFEITGLEMVAEEFKDFDTSDEEEDDEANLPQLFSPQYSPKV